MKLARTVIYFAVALPGVWIAGTTATASAAPAILLLSQLLLAAYGVPCAVGIAASLQRQATLLVLGLISIVLVKFPDIAGITSPAMALALGAGLGALLRRIVEESQDVLAPPQEVPHRRSPVPVQELPQERLRPLRQEAPQERLRVMSQEVPHERPRIVSQ